MIIGITGANGSGKDFVGQYLAEKLGWQHFSLSDELRDIARERGLGLDRTTLQKLGNEMREKHGPDYLSQRILARAPKNFVVTSIRNMSEIMPLKKQGGFTLVFVDALLNIRYQRTCGSRDRASESRLSLDEFITEEQREMAGGATGQQLQRVFAMADIKIDNDGTIEELEEKLDRLMREVMNESTKLG